MTLSRLFVFASLFFLPAAVYAQAQTSMTFGQLQQLCDSKYDVDAGMCAGYVTAVADHLMQIQNPNDPICLSPAIAPQTLVDNLRRLWSREAPAQQDLAILAVERGLRRQFHCP